MAEFNGVIQPLSDGAQDLDYRAEKLVFWGASRAAFLAVSPKFSGLTLCANATYMVTAIARLHGETINGGAIVGLVGGVTTALGTTLAATLIPVKAVRIPAAIALTYVVGKLANIWIKDGMPGDVERYQPMFAEWLAAGKTLATDIFRDLGNSLPFTQGQRDLWAGITNEVTYAASNFADAYVEKMGPIKEKWHAETKYDVHDAAATVVENIKGKMANKVCPVTSAASGAVEMAKAATSILSGNVKEAAKAQLDKIRG